MSEAVLFTGKRGAGKTLGALYWVREYLNAGRVVATNLDLYLENLVHASNRTCCYRLPDWPSADNLRSLPLGNKKLFINEQGLIKQKPGFSEDENGLLLLDEVVTFLGAREWQGKQRQEIINFLVQSRKYGWDLGLICQHPRLLDSAIRDSIMEIHGQAKRLDKIRVPVLGAIWKFFSGKPLMMPKWHVIPLVYGFQPGAPLWDRWMFSGKNFYDAYDTTQVINPEVGNNHLYTVLSAYHMKGRYLSVFAMYKFIIIVAMLIGFVFGVPAGWFIGEWNSVPVVAEEKAKEVIRDDLKVTGVMDNEGITTVMLSDGAFKLSTASKADKDGVRYLVDGSWYRVAK